MAPTTDTRTETTVALDAPPPLKTGQRLTPHEFMRRYEAMPNLKKAELIEGVVFVGSPVRTANHGYPHAMIVWWLGNYRLATPGLLFTDNGTLWLPGGQDIVQPDAMLFRTDGGAAHLRDDDYVAGAPELLVEVSASSMEHDMITKHRVYQRCGVAEYLVWQVEAERVAWFALADSGYVELPPDEAGILRSTVFPGLWLDVPALLADDMAQVLATLQRGIGKR
jgi:Uma2 family endonuclease